MKRAGRGPAVSSFVSHHSGLPFLPSGGRSSFACSSTISITTQLWTRGGLARLQSINNRHLPRFFVPATRCYTTDTPGESKEHKFDAADFIKKLDALKQQGKQIWVHPADLDKILAASRVERDLRDKAIRLIDVVKGGRTVYYNRIIERLVRMREKYQVFRLMQKMEGNGIGMDIYTFGTALKVCTTEEECNSVWAAMRQAKVQPDVAFFTSMINFHLNDKGAGSSKVSSAMKIYDQMKEAGVQPDLFLMTTLMKAHERGRDLKGATKLLYDMDGSKLQPNEVTYLSYIGVCRAVGSLDAALQILSYMRKKGLRPDAKIFTELAKIVEGKGADKKHIDALVKEVEVEGPELRLDMPYYTALINLYTRQGDASKAFEVLEEAVGRGLKPDKMTFHSLIYTCSEEGNVDLAFDTLFQMGLQGINPDEGTFASLMKVCAQNGDAERAVGLLHNMFKDRMIVPSDDRILLSFVQACQKAKNMGASLTLVGYLENMEKGWKMGGKAARALVEWLRKVDPAKALQVMERLAKVYSDL